MTTTSARRVHVSDRLASDTRRLRREGLELPTPAADEADAGPALTHRSRCPQLPLRTEVIPAERHGPPRRGAQGEYLGDAPGEPVIITRCIDCGVQVVEGDDPHAQ